MKLLEKVKEEQQLLVIVMNRPKVVFSPGGLWK